ncbi:MAG: hypothetical protein V4819_18615 [Verrucomicrobiota bacterium]
MKRLIQVISITLFSSSVSQGLVEFTEEASFVVQVELSAHEYAEAHAGSSPTSWTDLQPYSSKPFDEVFPRILPTKRYAFLPKPVQIHALSDEEILLIARKPIRNFTSYRNWYGSRSDKLGDPGRYMLTRSKSQGFLRKWLPEVAVQRIFRDATAGLPEPDNEPERQYMIDFRRKKRAPWIALAAVVLGTFILWFINRSKPDTPVGSS